MTKAEALLICTVGAEERLRDNVSKACRSLAARLLEVAEAAEDPKGLLNTLGELQGRAMILEASIGGLAQIRQLLYAAHIEEDAPGRR